MCFDGVSPRIIKTFFSGKKQYVLLGVKEIKEMCFDGVFLKLYEDNRECSNLLC